MKGIRIWSAAGAIGLVLAILFGCAESEKSPATGTELQSDAKQAAVEARLDRDAARKAERTRTSKETVVNPAQDGPKIVFEKDSHDFGMVGPVSSSTTEYKFQNTGNEKLVIKRIQSTCGCTVPDLPKKEYEPGESGAIKVTFKSSNREGKTTKHLYVYSNDESNPKYQLEISAQVVLEVSVEPDTMNLSLVEPNAGLKDIVVTNKSGKPFSIKEVTDLRGAITVDVNPNVKQARYVLHPKADMEKLKDAPNGTIRISTDLPNAPQLHVTYFAPPVFQVSPPRIIIREAKPGETIQREVTILSNYGEALDITSIHVQNESMKVVSQEPGENNTIKMMVEITPPSGEAESRYFTDTMTITLESGQVLEIRCSGWFER